MKVNGIQATPPKSEFVVIPREGGNLVFECKCVLDYEPFEKMCPMPTPAKIIYAPGVEPLKEDKEYNDAINEWVKNQNLYMIVASLKDCVEFELVKLGDYKTWGKLDEEFKQAGIIGVEYAKILEGVTTANGLNSDKLEQAKESFLAGLVTKEK